MTGALYTRYELIRAFRNRRFFFFSLGFPLILYFIIAGPQSSQTNFGGTGISAALFYMAGLVSFGTMTSMISTGARIAGERQVGWTRQLRATPLSTRSYFRAKVLTAYAMAGLTIAALYIAGAILGVNLAVGNWLEMTGLILVGLLPFAALGIVLGHLLTVDSIGPAIGGLTALLALVGGVWFPVNHGFLHDVGQGLPSYWLAQAGHVGSGGSAWGAKGWLVMAAWTVILGGLAGYAYRRDTSRV
ncbi:MAG TPA: ABC transporter permease [Solirubrobacteraceae bacterium]|jgi:ABC-2 type transport system permease protein|nr:ABC transporter permease [Solirubrobacteraceae bacterium]